MAHTDSPVRAGVFSSFDDAQRAVNLLREAGFSHDEIAIVAADEDQTFRLRGGEHELPAGRSTPAAAAAGGTLGATLAGGVGLAAGAVSGDPAMAAAAGGLGAWTGAMLGGLVGAMLTRGQEKEVADYYDQALAEGSIVVGVEPADGEAARLVLAEQLLIQAGAVPRELAEG